MESIQMKAIGIIHTQFENRRNMPIQPNGNSAGKGSISIFNEYKEGLEDLDGFSHIILIYYLHQNTGYKLKLKPFMDHNEHGIFATRAPHRPNSIGLSVVKIESIEENMITFDGADMLNNTPLLDIKPYIPAFDSPDNCKTGWYPDQGNQAEITISDDRFI
ncbi:MAG: tRNA (N6-threonylcarbamoyladenosine(37)-N6)-methyltransferase TrmO [Bacteroidales bacterium]|nr:tRNA (N6-threonylcarbamoyladenosine(37)-N6)-methyltransferase TrmO [Bacteroidales bacterium]